MEVEFMPCPTCTEVTVVEVPPCLDEHGFDCPDRACTMCGTALTVAGVAVFADRRDLVNPVRRAARRSWSAA